MANSSDLQRVAFSPGEFAALFGKSQTWGYREIYAGRVKTITQHGRILIPAKEVQRILESADIYNGQAPTPSVKARLAKMKTEKQNVWRKFVEARRKADGQQEAGQEGSRSGPKGGNSRAAALARLAGRVAKKR